MEIGAFNRIANGGIMYNIVLHFYKTGKYTKDDVRQFVASGQITEDQFREITAEEGVDS